MSQLNDQQLLTSSLLFLPDGGRGSPLAAPSSNWLGSEVMLDGCGCGELLLERAGAGAPVLLLLLCCSLSAGENERVSVCVCVWEGQSHTRTREGARLFRTSSCCLPTFHAGGYSRNLRCTVVRALLLFHQHGQQTRAETQARADHD